MNITSDTVNHRIYLIFLDITTISAIILNLFSIYIINRSPPSKELKEYRLCSHFQQVYLFLNSICWSFFGKYIPILDKGVVFCEGYNPYIGLPCYTSYSFACFCFGSYAAYFFIALLYRIRIITRHDHIMNNDWFFYGLCSTILIFLVIPPTIIVTCMFTLTDDIAFTILKDLPVYFEAYSKRKSIIAIPYSDWTFKAYTSFFTVMLGISGVALLPLVRYIVVSVQLQQSRAAGQYKYHMKVLKILLIQSATIFTIMGCAPLVILISLFTNVHIEVLLTAIILFANATNVQVILVLTLNTSYRKTVRDFIPCFIIKTNRMIGTSSTVLIA